MEQAKPEKDKTMKEGMFDLGGKRALVTGAGTGLGRQFAHTLAGAGAEVVLAARRVEKLEETAELIRGDGGSADCVALDVTERASVERCFEEAGGVFDVVINNAGISREAFLANLEEADWDAVLDTNLKGVFLVAQAAARGLIAAERPGSIVNIASILGYRLQKTLAAYIAAKAAVIRLTEAMALEWTRFGIRANAIAPGFFVTEMNREYFEQGDAEQLTGRIPMKRPGELHELDGALLLLASDAGSYMTGSTVTVDGGHLCSPL